MKVINKETGEIGYLYANKNENYNVLDENDKVLAVYETLEAVVGEWQDYEEPKSGIKDVWFPDVIEGRNNVVISFETREEAKNAVRKLKAWKRLKDKGFKFTGFAHKDRGRLDELEIYCQLGECPEDIEDMEDVCFLFGGEE